MAYTTHDVIDSMIIKNLLITTPQKALDQGWTKQDLIMFIKTTNKILSEEPAFFLLDQKLISGVEAVINNHRFNCKDNSITDGINNIIIRINHLKSLSAEEQKQQLQIYVENQQQIREIVFLNNHDLLVGISYDKILAGQLVEERLRDVNPSYFFSSTNYLIKKLPHIYMVNPRRLELTVNKLNEHANKKGLLYWAERSTAKRIIKNLEKVKTKGE